jgi:hypothetical protein
MTVNEKALEIITKALVQHTGGKASEMARHILDALKEVRIVPIRLRASQVFWTRYHAHCRYVGDMDGRGHDYWHNRATRHAFKMHMWPYKIVPTQVTVNGVTIDVDVPVRDSSRNATNTQLMEAYSVIQDEAKRQGYELPEDSHEQIRTPHV